MTCPCEREGTTLQVCEAAEQCARVIVCDGCGRNISEEGAANEYSGEGYVEYYCAGCCAGGALENELEDRHNDNRRR